MGYGKKSDIWAKLGYERAVLGGSKHLEKWVDWHQLQAPLTRTLASWRRPSPSP